MGIHLITPLYVMVMQPKVKYDLMISSGDGGDVTTPGEGLFAGYNAGAVVNLVATPDDGYGFVNWTGDVGTIANVNAASTTITMNGDYSITANFIALYGPPVTVTYYPTSKHTGVAADGMAWRDITNNTWANQHDGAGTWGGDEDVQDYARIIAGTSTGKWKNISRVFAHCDTTLLPANAVITAAEVGVFVYSKVDTLVCLPSLALVQSNDPTPGSIVAADYQNIAALPIAPVKTYDQVTVGAYNIFAIPEANFPLITKAGVTKFGFREYKYDCLNTAPPWTSGKICGFLINMDESIPWKPPYLEVTYKLPL